MDLVKSLALLPGIISICGSGGKTTLLFALASALAARGAKVIVSTTTHMMKPSHLPLSDGHDAAALLKKHPCIFVGAPTAEPGKYGCGGASIGSLGGLCDYLLLEADGSRRLPLKAHAPHEPVIPPESDRAILVVGASGLNCPISEAVHRPEIFCRLTGALPTDLATEERVAEVICRENIGDTVLINQADTNPKAAERLASLLPMPTVVGSLNKGGQTTCLS